MLFFVVKVPAFVSTPHYGLLSTCIDFYLLRFMSSTEAFYGLYTCAPIFHSGFIMNISHSPELASPVYSPHVCLLGFCHFLRPACTGFVVMAVIGNMAFCPLSFAPSGRYRRRWELYRYFGCLLLYF